MKADGERACRTTRRQDGRRARRPSEIRRRHGGRADAREDDGVRHQDIRPAKSGLPNPTHNQHYYGLPQECYTLSENLTVHTGSAAAQRTNGLEMSGATRTTGRSSRRRPHRRRARCARVRHTNAFGSAAMTYDVTAIRVSDCSLVMASTTATHQCYATGGYGPNERYMAIDGALGHALDTRSDTSRRRAARGRDSSCRAT